jgi:hypothetical protein
MNQKRWAIPFAFLPLAMIGCVAPQQPRVREPVRWIVVEKGVRDLVKEGLLVDRPLDESSTLLAMQPLYPEDLNWVVKVEAQDFFVELLEIAPGRTAAPGERVSAKVRVGNAQKEATYRLSARPSSGDVRLVGNQEILVRGPSPATFAFTSLSPGAGGIAIAIERLNTPD